MNQGTMSHKSLSLKTAAVFVASTLMLGACSSSSGESLQEGAAQDEELSPQQKLENEAGVKIDPGIASCEFNNELKTTTPMEAVFRRTPPSTVPNCVKKKTRM